MEKRCDQHAESEPAKLKNAKALLLHLVKFEAGFFIDFVIRLHVVVWLQRCLNVHVKKRVAGILLAQFFTLLFCCFEIRNCLSEWIYLLDLMQIFFASK